VHGVKFSLFVFAFYSALPISFSFNYWLFEV